MCANLPRHRSTVGEKNSDWTICRESKKRQLFYVPVSYFQVTVLTEAGNVFDASLTNSVELAPKSLFYYLKIELSQHFVVLKVRRIHIGQSFECNKQQIQ